MSRRLTIAAALAVGLCHVVVAGRAVEARQTADVAARLSGTWVLNRDLSTGFGAPGRGRGGPRLGARFAATAFAAAQRGGGGGGGASDPGDLTPEQRAQQAAMRQLQQIDERITIKAAADAVTFIDVRGERTYVVNDKPSEIFVASFARQGEVEVGQAGPQAGIHEPAGQAGGNVERRRHGSPRAHGEGRKREARHAGAEGRVRSPVD